MAVMGNLAGNSQAGLTPKIMCPPSPITDIQVIRPKGLLCNDVQRHFRQAT